MNSLLKSYNFLEIVVKCFKNSNILITLIYISAIIQSQSHVVKVVGSQLFVFQIEQKDNRHINSFLIEEYLNTLKNITSNFRQIWRPN